VDKFGAQNILVTSFSRAAAAELAGRDLPIEGNQIGTLHSICWHALNGPEIAEANVEDWNKTYPALALSKRDRQDKLDGEDVPEDEVEGDRSGNAMLERLGRMRGLMLDRQYWPAMLRTFEQKWTEYKQANGLLDFTDLIETCLRDVFVAPGRPEVIFADEAQDLNRMQSSLIRKWGERANYFIIAGDDDQCQPPGTLVRTTTGAVPISELDPAKHSLVSYAPTDGVLYGRAHGYRFRKSCRQYDYRMLAISAGGRTTRCTPEHKFYVRWVKGELLDRAHVVYLMQRGDRYRVGWCKLIRSDGIFHLGHRARMEGADGAWILRVFYDRTKASIYESYVATKYGLPLVTFEPVNGAQHYTRESLDEFFELLKLDRLPLRAAHCLLDHGRDPRFPLYTPARAAAKRGGSTQFLTEAANLAPEIMSVPVVRKRRLRWEPISISEQKYCGPVYSLDVEKYHTYVADGIVTHNCIYSFAGASPEAFLDPDIPADHKFVLKQSYRVPRAIHAFAERLIRKVSRRQPKEYLPRNEEGAIEKLTGKAETYRHIECSILGKAMEHMQEGKTVMFLASCSYMLRPIITVLRKNGIPFHNPYRKSECFWNPLASTRTTTASRLSALLVAHPEYGDGHRPWTHGDLVRWADVLQVKNVLRRGVKQKLKEFDQHLPVTLERLNELFEPAALESLMQAWDTGSGAMLDWWRERLASNITERAKFPIEIAKKRGPRALVEPPQVIVGTIHSVKGGQADVVYLFPDLSQAGDAQYARGGPARDAVIRLFYVGATRAYEKLVVCQRESALAISL
jgi:superfamily I DNA/RNA helicase